MKGKPSKSYLFVLIILAILFTASFLFPCICVAENFSIWSDLTVPGIVDAGPDGAVELGVRFRADTDGYITGIRFYKASSNIETHVGNLWSAGGVLLASAPFVGETFSGWQQVNFSSPVFIKANEFYTASYHTAVGHFSVDRYYFEGTSVDRAPLHVPADGLSGSNGVFAYGSTSSFPDRSWSSSNYWVDVVFSTTFVPDTIPPVVTQFIVPASAATLSVPITAFSASDNVEVTGYLLSESASAPTGTTSGWSATPPLSYSFTEAGSKTIFAWARDAAGNISAGRSANVTVTVTTTEFTFWPDTTLPALVDAGPDGAVELGVRFQSDVSGFVRGVRFYKASANTGSHVVNLWSASGSLMASATTAGETLSGWQQIQFSTPVGIHANTVYTVSYHTNFGHFSVDRGYFAGKALDRPPLHALADGESGVNGVFAYGAVSSFPSLSWNSSNYWVDVLFSTKLPDNIPPDPDITPPTVTAFTTPAIATALSVPIISLTASDNVAVTGFMVTESYTAPLATASDWSATAPLSYLFASEGTKTLYAWARDAAGNVSASRNASIVITLPDTTLPTVTAFTLPATATELTVMISSFTASDNVAVTGYLVSESATAPLATASGWSATAPLAYLFASGGTKTLYAWARDVVGNVSASRSASVVITLPDTTSPTVTSFIIPGAANTLTVGVTSFTATDNVAVTGYMLTVSATAPLSTSSGWSITAPVSYIFTSAGTKTLYAWAKDSAGNVSAGKSDSVVIDTTRPTVTAFVVPVTSTTLSVLISSFTASDTVGVGGYMITESSTTPLPTAAGWSASAPVSYTFASGGSKTLYAWAKDAAGNVSASKSASVNIMLPSNGPILVISSALNPFSDYYAEILRAEGFNAFVEKDISLVTTALLEATDIVILGEMPLTTAQVTMLSNWVMDGGRLIAMRPDKKLAVMLGLSDLAATISNAYLQINTATGPGVGIVNQTIQYHGLADLYDLNGASALATLYSNATTATSHPAVTLKDVGTSGGQAATFTYDLARSVVYTRQGNPVWSGQERDGYPPIRPDDLFYGNAASDPQPDWIDMNKVAIPQADEQQRLLANLLIQMNQDKKPLPRFWYFPRSLPAVVVMTGDDHGWGTAGTAGRFDSYVAKSPVGCVVDNWECIRSTSYVWPTAAIILSAAQAVAYNAAGFEIALHVNTGDGSSNPITGCADFTPSSLDTTLSSQLIAFSQKFSGLPKPVTNRNHCVVWSDYASVPTVELNHGIRLDTSYYYYPAVWVANRAGFFSGSGMPMRFTDPSGALIDTYQATTQLTDESGQTYPATINALLDGATGPSGYYGAFVANMHTDIPASSESDAIITAAKAHGIPVISARQLLNWLDGRNGSTFGSFSYNLNSLSFAITAAQGSNGLVAMVPLTGRQLVSNIMQNGTGISFKLMTVKGIKYATFQASTGNYQINYADTTAPIITDFSVPAAVPTLTIPVMGINATDNVAVTGYLVSDSAITPLPTASGWSLTVPVSVAVATAGSKTIYAWVRDAAGNVSAAATATVMIDLTAPVVSITSPLAGAIITDSVVVSVSASDNDTISKVEFYLDGILEQTDTVSPYSWTWNSEDAAGGSHLLRAKAYDAAGNVTTSNNVAVNVSTSIRLVQKTSSIVSSEQRLMATLPAMVTAGNLIVVSVTGWPNLPAAVPVTDSLGNSYSIAGTVLTVQGAYSAIYFAKNVKAGTTTVTFNTVAAGGQISMVVAEFSNVDQVSPLDATAGTSGLGTSPFSGTMTSSSAGNLVIGSGTHNGTTVTTAGAGFTMVTIATEDSSTHQPLAMEYQLSNGELTSVDFSLNAPLAWIQNGALFKHK